MFHSKAQNTNGIQQKHPHCLQCQKSELRREKKCSATKGLEGKKKYWRKGWEEGGKEMRGDGGQNAW